MQYRTFGETGIRVSALGFGVMRLPTLEDGTVDLDKSVPLLRLGIDLGINYIDTAYVYIKGTSEVAVGQAIKGYDREELYLATKIPARDEERAKADVWRAKLEESLERFDTPYIDFILFHALGKHMRDSAPRVRGAPGLGGSRASKRRSARSAVSVSPSAHRIFPLSSRWRKWQKPWDHEQASPTRRLTLPARMPPRAYQRASGLPPWSSQ